MTTSPPQKIVHLHIPKTAGTAFRLAFEQATAGSLRVFPHYNERQYANVEASQYDFFSGHIGFKTANQLGGNIVTVLRHPVDRFVSVYYFWRQLFEEGAERSRNTILAHKYSLKEFVKIRDEPFLLEEFHNRMTWQIAHGSSLALRRELRDTGTTEDAIFKLALSNLKGFAVVGVQERLGIFEEAIRKIFSIELRVRRTNVTESRPSVEAIGIETIRAIQEWTYMDLELYQQAYKLVANEGL